MHDTQKRIQTHLKVWVWGKFSVPASAPCVFGTGLVGLASVCASLSVSALAAWLGVFCFLFPWCFRPPVKEEKRETPKNQSSAPLPVRSCTKRAALVLLPRSHRNPLLHCPWVFSLPPLDKPPPPAVPLSCVRWGHVDGGGSHHNGRMQWGGSFCSPFRPQRRPRCR